jgi:hypothetical protein
MIDSYEFGRIRINGKEYTTDVIIYPNRIRSNWWRKQGHKLLKEDLEEVFEHAPEVLIVGTGAYGSMKVPEDTQRFIKSKNIELIVKKTKDACDIYNDLNKKNVVAALHLTC